MRPKIDQILSKPSWKWTDGWAKAIQGFVQGTFKVLPGGKFLKDVLHGTKVLRHPLHPAMTDVPLGAWLTGVIADYLAITTNLAPRSVGTIALAIGLAGALGAALTGYTDFSETYGLERRTGLVHGLIMTIVVAVMGASFVLRLVGVSSLYPVAVGLATFGLFVTMFGMYIGGHLPYGFATMIDHTTFIESYPKNFVAVGAPSDFPEGEMKKVEAKGMAVMMVRYQGALHAVSNTCTHAGGPLDEGELKGDLVECPWHGSLFCVTDGDVRGGPATFPVPKLEVREDDGTVEVALLEPLR